MYFAHFSVSKEAELSTRLRLIFVAELDAEPFPSGRPEQKRGRRTADPCPWVQLGFNGLFFKVV